MFLYNALSSPLDHSKLFTLHPRRTCSFRHQLDFSLKHSRHAAITRNDYSTTFTQLSTAVYSQALIYTAQSTGASWREQKMPKLRISSNGDLNPGSLDCESGVLPQSYGAPNCNRILLKLLHDAVPAVSFPDQRSEQRPFSTL